MANAVKQHDLHVYLSRQLMAYDLSLDTIARLLTILFGSEEGFANDVVDEAARRPTWELIAV